MRLVARLSWVFVLLVSAIGGCTQVTGPPLGTAPVTITVSSWPGVPAPLEDVELCETGTANCVLTDDDGKAMLHLPVGESSFTKTRKGYGSFLVALVIPAQGLAHRSFAAAAPRMEHLYENLMSPWPMADTGAISTEVMPPLEGATFDLVDVAGRPAGKPFYQNELGDWTPDLTATTSAGIGGFVELSPGEYRVEFSGTAEDCTPQWGWPARFQEHANGMRLPVRKGHMTQARMVCPPPP